MKFLKQAFKLIQQSARLMIGVPDYQNYVLHCRQHHPDKCMSYEEFFRERQLNRYDGRKPGRCC